MDSGALPPDLIGGQARNDAFGVLKVQSEPEILQTLYLRRT